MPASIRGVWVMLAPVLCCAAQVQAPAQSDSFAANRKLAQFYIGKNDVAEALPWLEKAARLNPGDYNNNYDLAVARLETKDVRGARQLVEKMLAAQDRSELHNLLGDIEEAAGRVDEAEKQYERAARIDPTEKNLFDLGTDLLRHHAYPPALTVFQYATEKYPRAARLEVGLGVALYSAGKYEDAVETLCRAVDMDPRDTKALDFLGGMYDVSPGLAGEVTKRLARFVEQYPNNAAANYYYALSLRKRNLTPGLAGSEDKVESLLKRSVMLQPDFAAAHFQLGLLYSDEDRRPDAIRELEEAVRLDPGLKSAHYRLAQLYAQQGKTEQSRAEFQLFRSLKDRE